MSLSVTPKMDKVVRSKLHQYLYLNEIHTHAILRRMMIYYPMIERKLRENGLPQDLKYMVLVESEIDPLAESGDGALGLWQFMPKTAQSLGLRITTDIDERRDPELSTDAAIRYLKMLYRRFNNWELVMAAYNGGATRVRRAQKKAGFSKDFWKVKKYLPKESAEFISRFTAAAYLGTFYKYHFFQPPSINLDLQLTSQITIKKHTRFSEISKKTGIPVYILMELNPMYKKSYIPKSARGHKLIVPKRVLHLLNPEIKTAYNSEHLKNYDPNQYYTIKLYQVAKHETIYTLAKKLDADAFLIKYWNHMDKLVTMADREMVSYAIK